MWLKILFTILCFELVILTGCNGPTEEKVTDEKTIILKMAHHTADNHPANIASVQFAENVEERTNGKVVIEIYSNSQLGTPPELLEQNIVGSIDMSLPTQGALDKYSKKFATVMLPFVFDDYEHAYRVLDGEFSEWVSEDIEKQGLIMLSNWDYGFRNITNNIHPISVPDDMIGLKLRTPPEIQLQSAMESLGANVTKIAYPEIYLALQQGIVDGQENPLSIIYYDQLYEVQQYLAMTRHSYNAMVHIISKKTWDKLSPDQQRIIREESLNAQKLMRNNIQKQEEMIVEMLQQKGMEVTYPERKVFQKKMSYAYDAISIYAGKENVEYFLKIVEDER